jgi:hypothetical protein
MALAPSQWIALALIAFGLLYIIFVGEPRSGVQRHPFLPYLGWIIVAFVATVTLVVSVAGYTVSTFGPRILTVEQAASIKKGLAGSAGTVSVLNDMACSDCGPYGNQISRAIDSAPGWHSGVGSVLGHAAVTHGIGVRGDQPELSIVLSALWAAHLNAEEIPQRVSAFESHSPAVEIVISPKIPK